MDLGLSFFVLLNRQKICDILKPNKERKKIMPKIVNVDKNNFKEKLDFIGLNLEKIPKFLMDFEPLGFGTSSSFNDNEHKIFRYIPIQ